MAGMQSADIQVPQPQDLKRISSRETGTELLSGCSLWPESHKPHLSNSPNSNGDEQLNKDSII